MLNLEYHKGQPCVFKPILCQEGFCSECIIGLEQSSQIKSSIIEENQQFVFKSKVYNKHLRKPEDIKSFI